jgi:uncharacterized protein (TIGR02466 family)
MDSEIIGIFPTPIYKSKLNRKLTKEELNFINKSKLDVNKNEGNITSNNNYILNNKIFRNLKKEIELKIKYYYDNIIDPKNKISFYITQSWLNYTDKNQFHHRHKHSNSLISGVFYINCDEKFDKITFFKKDTYQTIEMEPKKWNLWNSSSWFFPVKTNDIILFPSSTEHMVETKEGDNTRISLAFNVFIKGTVGNNKNLTELIL